MQTNKKTNFLGTAGGVHGEPDGGDGDPRAQAHGVPHLLLPHLSCRPRRCARYL